MRRILKWVGVLVAVLVVVVVSLPFLIWYPITRKSHAALLQELAERKAAAEKVS